LSPLRGCVSWIVGCKLNICIKIIGKWVKIGHISGGHWGKCGGVFTFMTHEQVAFKCNVGALYLKQKRNVNAKSSQIGKASVLRKIVENFTHSFAFLHDSQTFLLNEM
jgi:hypothetical protein